jgi:hypothetical protein
MTPGQPKPVFASAKGNEAWLLLLEKVITQLMSCCMQ